MAGCFGDHPYDRWLESQTNAYLNQGADLEKWMDSLTISDDYFIHYFDVLMKFSERLYDKGYTPKQADGILNRYFKSIRVTN